MLTNFFDTLAINSTLNGTVLNMDVAFAEKYSGSFTLTPGRTTALALAVSTPEENVNVTISLDSTDLGKVNGYSIIGNLKKGDSEFPHDINEFILFQNEN